MRFSESVALVGLNVSRQCRLCSHCAVRADVTVPVCYGILLEPLRLVKWQQLGSSCSRSSVKFSPTLIHSCSWPDCLKHIFPKILLVYVCGFRFCSAAVVCNGLVSAGSLN
jgi:hypothetical protein